MVPDQQVKGHKSGDERTPDINGNNGSGPFPNSWHHVMHAKDDYVLVGYDLLIGELRDRDVEITS